VILNFILSNNLIGTVVYTMIASIEEIGNRISIHEITNPCGDFLDLNEQEESDLFDFIEIAHYKMVIEPGL